MRNPDPAPARYTSLAWAAVCGCEDIFEYLLLMCHDDEELSKDAEKNTILCLLAGAPGNSPSGSMHTPMDDATTQASMRMARMYLQRFPFITDWCNQHGKTALHIAASNGNDEFVRLVLMSGSASAWGHIPVADLMRKITMALLLQTMHTRRYPLTAYDHNNSNVTPDISNSVLEALQETARNRWEVSKKSRVVAQQQARRAYGQGVNRQDEFSRLDAGVSRFRSGSGTTSASDSTDFEIAMSTSAPGSSQFSGHSSSGSLPRPPPSNGTILTPIPSSAAANGTRNRNTSTSSSHAPSHSSRPSISSIAPNGRSNPPTSSSSLGVKSSSVKNAFSPIARLLERDADAMAEYRTRSGSHSSVTTAEANLANA
ncbi:1974_t:CDS:2, partial [Acaulospora colombiana]